MNKLVAARDGEQLRTFTGNKLDWMSGVMSDPRLDARAFEVGFCVAQHVNQETGLAILSDDTIADKTGIPKRWVLRARISLREAGWIDWRRTKTANVYWRLDDRLNAVLDHQAMLKEARSERRENLQTGRRETPPVAHLKRQETPPVAQLESPPVAIRETPPVANIHLSIYTVVDTPSKILPSIEEPLPAITHPQLAETRLIEELGEGDSDRGLSVAETIGDARFRFLLTEFRAGRLYLSAVRAAISQDLREVAA